MSQELGYFNYGLAYAREKIMPMLSPRNLALTVRSIGEEARAWVNSTNYWEKALLATAASGLVIITLEPVHSNYGLALSGAMQTGAASALLHARGLLDFNFH